MQNCFFDLDLRIDMSVKVIPNVPVAINVKDGFYNIYNSNAVVMVQLIRNVVGRYRKDSSINQFRSSL